MTCSLCGGLVTWRGRLSALTHTQCAKCGEKNCQIVESYSIEDENIPDKPENSDDNDDPTLEEFYNRIL